MTILKAIGCSVAGVATLLLRAPQSQNCSTACVCCVSSHRMNALVSLAPSDLQDAGAGALSAPSPLSR